MKKDKKETNWLEDRMSTAAKEMEKWPDWKRKLYKNNVENPSYANS